MLHQCATWETCMNRDPKIVGRAKVGAEMLAEVINGFIEPISWKTLVRINRPSRHNTILITCVQAFTLSSLAFLTVFVNALLSLYRSRLHQDSNRTNDPSHHHPHMPPHFPPPYLSTHPYGYLHGNWQKEDTMPRQRRRLENGEAVPVTEGSS